MAPQAPDRAEVEEALFELQRYLSDRIAPLMIAAEMGRREMVSALAQAGAETQLRDNYGLTAAGRARRAGHDGIERLLGGTR